jgi:hypothetical protein
MIAAVFQDILSPADASRAAAVLGTISKHGLRCGLTGGLAIALRLREQGRAVPPRPLNDIDLVVERFSAIPESLADSFLLQHVHPDAGDGKTLLQLIDERHRVRVDIFLAFGHTLARAEIVGTEPAPFRVVCVEDLIARTTALVCGRLRRGLPLDPKHAEHFLALRGLGDPRRLDEAWTDHRQQVPGTFGDADHEAMRLLQQHPQLQVPDVYSPAARTCTRCRSHGAFVPGSRERIVQALGYF